MSEPLPLDFGIGFKALGDRLKTERDERIAMGSRVLKFGVQFLDMSLGGIFPNDLIILGAKTGAGKTALSSIIARTNAAAGKRVHYFALEAEDKEIERRLKYLLLSETLFQYLTYDEYKALNYLDWYLGKLDKITARYETTIEAQLASMLGSLQTFYRSKDFTADDFERTVLGIQDQTDLVILDHLHYVDTTDADQNRGYERIVKKIRDVALNIGKPVVVVAHIRKGDRRAKQLVPDLDDFHGTSNVPKIATKAIMLAPAYDQPTEKSHLWSTYIHPAKCRFDGSRTRFVGLATFNARRTSYEKSFQLGRMISDGTEWEALPSEQLPEWAKDPQ